MTGSVVGRPVGEPPASSIVTTGSITPAGISLRGEYAHDSDGYIFNFRDGRGGSRGGMYCHGMATLALTQLFAGSSPGSRAPPSVSSS